MHSKPTRLKLQAFTLAAVFVVACAAPGLAQPTITTQPASQTGLGGSYVIFSVTVDGTGPFAYQWQLNGTNLGNNIISTVAGTTTSGFSGDGGPATNATLNNPQGVAFDPSGNLYVADYYNYRIRKVDTRGIITTVAGNGTSGFSGDGDAATNAKLNCPTDVALDSLGNLYIADGNNGRIRRVDTNGIIRTVAGGGAGGDGGAATNASLRNPQNVAFDSVGNLYIAENSAGRIRKVDTNGIITTVAGKGTLGFSGDGGAATNASLYEPCGITVSASGNLYIADSQNSRVRMVGTNGVITTVAGGGSGGDGGAATNASLSDPFDVAFDVLGNLYIADYRSNKIRKVDTNGIITTVAGGGSGGDGGAATNAIVSNPSGMAFDASGNLYIAQYPRIRKVLAYANYPTLRLSNLTSNDAGSYTVVITNSSGSVTSSVATLTMGFAPSIVTQPVSQTILAGSNVTFSVAALGTAPLDYCWCFNGTNVVQDGTNATITLNDLTTNNAGAYSVVITNLCGSITSGVATLTVTLPPSIIAQPTGQTVWIGSNAIFSVTAGGTGPFNYQWQLNGSNILNNLIATVAGNGSATNAGDRGPATNASLNYPYGVALDSSGNVYVADTSNHRIRRIDTNGVITTVAGNGTGSFSGDGAAATNATLNSPEGVALDASGNLYVADTSNARVRRVGTNGIITTVAGGGSGPDGVAATNANLAGPYGVALSASGNLYIVEKSMSRVRIVGTDGIIRTFAGKGTASFSGDGGYATNATLNGPTGAALNAFGNLYIADYNNNRIRKVATNGVITTVAGYGTSGYFGEGIAATAAFLYYTSGVALDALGNLFIADYENNRIRKVDTNNIITTIAGIGSAGFSGDGGAAASAGLNLPSGVALDVLGNLYIADDHNQRIRKVGGSPTLVLSNVTASAVGNYTVVISSVWGSVTSSIAALALDGPPGIVSQPASQAVLAGSNATFQVAPAGTAPFDFAWYSNGTNLITDGTNAWLELDQVSTNDAGPYTVVITNQYGSVTSSIAVLTVALLPAIVAQPAPPPTVLIGDNVLLSVAVAGTGPFSYQWQWNGTNLPNNIITTVAGTGGFGLSGDGGPATSAMLAFPYDAAFDVVGNMYIADFGNGVVRKVDTHGIITTFATGFSGPGGLAVDASGNVYVADYYNNRICKVGTDGTVSTVAGGHGQGFSGDGGPATSATISHPQAVALDANGNLFIADDVYNHRIRKVDTSGIITTVAGNGTEGFSGDGGLATNANLDYPSGVTLDTAGNLYIGDWNNNRVRKVDIRGIISTVAGGGSGGDGGLAINASLWYPSAVTVDALGNLYIADTYDNCIRKVDTNGIITTVAGGWPPNSLQWPRGVHFDSSGNLYIADTRYNLIQELDFAGSPTLRLNNVTTNSSGDYSVVITTPWGSITSSVATVMVQIRPSIARTVLHTDGSVTLNCAGTPNSTNRVWVATSLTPPVVWWPASTNLAGADGTWQFTDTDTAGYPARFYRVSMP